jgi:hypothetical protein
MSAAKSAELSTKKKIIKPLSATELIKENVRFSNVKNNTELGLKWVDTSYARDGAGSGDDKLLIVARGCVIKTFGKIENKGKDGKEAAPAKDGKPRKDKFSIFMSLKDEEFIDMINTFERYLEQVGHENSQAWFDNDFSVEECHDMLKSCVSKNDKYGYAIGGTLSRDFTCRSKTEEVPDVSDLTVALAKNNIVDVCLHINKVKLGAGTYRLGMEITQINVIGVSEGTGESRGMRPDEYTSGQITLTPMQQHEKGGKFCKMLYQDRPVRIYLENIKGRIFKFEKDDTVSYSMSIRLADSVFRKMIEGIDEEVFNLLVANSKEYLGAKKTAKLARPMVKQIYSYNKTDTEKIKKGEKPTYDPSIWLKIYFSDEKGFDGKITNAETGKAIQNTEDLINKDLDISSLDFYSRHIWFAKQATVNLTLGKCAITYETTEYDMDAIEGAGAATGAAASGDEEEETETQEVANSDDE